MRQIIHLTYKTTQKALAMRILTTIFLCLLITLPVVSQTRIVTGKITVFNTYPVKNVEVTSKKAKSTVMTDSLGHFELVCNEKDAIMVKTKVFESFSKKVTLEDDFVTANLIFQDSKYNRESAVGLGYLESDQLSYALMHLRGENNDFCNYSNIFSLIRVKFPEAQIKRGSNGVSEGVYIRGNKSFELETEAVYEVDGMKVAEISFLNPCDIASIDIMKSGGTAVYGTQAVNGVVIIKTRGN